MEEYLTIKEVAELWQVSVRRVQRYQVNNSPD